MRILSSLALLWLAAVCAGCSPEESNCPTGGCKDPVALKIETASLAEGRVGASYQTPLLASGGTPPYAWTVASGQLPPGLSLDGSGMLSGTPTSAADTQFLVSLHDTTSGIANVTFRLRVRPVRPAITTAQQDVPNGVVGTTYSVAMVATGGSAPYQWQLSAGSLPAGLNLNQATGVISGTPASPGTASFTIAVTDADAENASAALSAQIFPPAAPSITTASQLPNGVVGAVYGVTLAAAGGTAPYRWQVTAGSLPGGLSLNQNTGAISGTPTSAVTASPTIAVTDALGSSVSAGFSLRIFPVPPSITTASLPGGVVGSAYSATLAAINGTTPYRWQVTAGLLPGGLSLNQNTGVISGTPTTAGNASPTITVTDADSSTATAAYAIAIFPAPPTITTGSMLLDGVVGIPYSVTLAAAGGTTPYRWQVTSGSLPAGLSLNQNTGAISGTPTTAGTANLAVTVTDANTGTASAGFTLRIRPAPPSITTAPLLPNGVIGSAYSTTLALTGGTAPYQWLVTVGSLPAGLNLNQATGVISGTPTTAITTNPTITVTDANNASASAAFTLRIQAAPVVITTASQLPDGVNGTAYSATLTATGGITPYQWQVTTGSLPAGLSLNQNTGVISGTPTSVVSANPTITVTDANNASASAAFVLTIKAAGTGWQLVWSDEFNGTTLDGSKWLNPQNYNQCDSYFQHTSAPDDAYLDGSGNLIIRAQQRASGGCGPNHQTAGQISTKNRFSQAYGKIEFRAQMPAGGGGIWPALWLDPLNGTWPPEIDVLEMVSDMSTAYMTYHWAQNGHQYSLASTTNPGLATGFHTYAVEWEPGVMRWFIDGVEARPAVTGSVVTNMPMGLLIDIYLGGWAGTVTASFPQYMYVDYVRVYSRP